MICNCGGVLKDGVREARDGLKRPYKQCTACGRVEVSDLEVVESLRLNPIAQPAKVTGQMEMLY